MLSDGHYLNLPVMNDGGEIVGMVDVLKLTYATLDQINTLSNSNDEGPAWNKFWLSLDNDTESVMSGDGSQSMQHTNLGSRITSPDVGRDRLGDSVAPGDSASHIGINSPARSIIPENGAQLPEEFPFPFKFKAPSGRVHRIKVIATEGIGAFVLAVAAKLGVEADTIGGTPSVEDGRIDGPGFALSYMDDEGDSVSITTDNDLLEAILLTRQSRRDKVDLFVHDPEKPPVSAPVDVALPTPPMSSTPAPQDTRNWWPEEEESGDEAEEGEEDDEDYETQSTLRKPRKARAPAAPPVPEQVIAGVPNELLLPGAIVTLAVVIVSVFTISRLTSR